MLKLLAEVKAYAAAHPNQQSMPANLESQIDGSGKALTKELASPHVMWKQLLKKKVSTSRRELDGGRVLVGPTIGYA